ncbi:MAG: exodeoxyribonuclease VII large subunit, partial [Clostridiales bacterium]|nr:exodeoxyribonuclease VII large subunit [Clostridiales bacterium]
MQVNALSVTALNEYVRRSLAGDPMLQGLALRGELSNFRPYASGHWYFALKDEESRIAGVL